jgi:TonB family protein
MKLFNSALGAILLLGPTSALKSQTANWIKVSPPGEEFSALMPQTPTAAAQKKTMPDLSVDGRMYTAVDGEVTYTVWSLKRTTPLAPKQSYLDSCADLVWDGLLGPVRDLLPKDKYIYAHMDYVRELTQNDDPGREYLLTLDQTAGVANFYVDNEKIYVLVVLNSRRDAPETERFLRSFSIPAAPAATPDPVELRVPILNPSAPGSPGGGMGMGPGPGTRPPDTSPAPSPAAEDYNKVFNTRDVTQKARITEKPNPSYTDGARKYRVKGTVVIRAVLSKDGQVTNIRVIRRLPHGLSEKAIEAARGLKFEPAVKDGHQVSTYVQLEYNFYLY